jgi:hypothetical protein
LARSAVPQDRVTNESRHQNSNDSSNSGIPNFLLGTHETGRLFYPILFEPFIERQELSGIEKARHAHSHEDYNEGQQ